MHIEIKDDKVRLENQGNLIAVIETNSQGLKTVGIYGDPQGLKFLGEVCLEVSKLNQKNLSKKNLPDNEGFHLHLREESELNLNSKDVIIGRLDSKEDESFDWFYPPIARRKCDTAPNTKAAN